MKFVIAGGLLLCILGGLTSGFEPRAHAGDDVRELQTKAIQADRAEFGHWGIDPDKYTQWRSHSNRLIPVYTFGTRGWGTDVDLESYTGANSAYRSEEKLQKIYNFLPTHTVDPNAAYCDQTNLYDLQLAAAKGGKKHVFLVIFDGMDWQTTRAAAIYAQQKVSYEEGRGQGLHFLDYTASDTTQFGWMVTSPHNEGTDTNVNTQTLVNPGGKVRGGYDPKIAGYFPWSRETVTGYLISKPPEGQAPVHAYTDSSSSASSMTAGLKTYNNSVNIDHAGQPVETIAHQLQRDGWLVGAVTSVPISHATPAATYAQNVHRDDYQDLTRDLLGLPSISHREQALAGLDILIGGGYGRDVTEEQKKSEMGVEKQGDNLVLGNRYLTSADLMQVDVKNQGKYVVAQRTSGVNGREALMAAATLASTKKQRLLGFYGVGAYDGHLPFATADGKYNPPLNNALPDKTPKAEEYTEADLSENPTLADMTTAALTALQGREEKFWLMVEAGDVDWANHANNIDNSIGAVLSGDKAVKVITDWVEQNSNWQESLLIVTADHGHYLVLTRPELLVSPAGK